MNNTTHKTLYSIILVLFCCSVVRTFDCGLVYSPSTESYSIFSKRHLVPYCLPTTEENSSEDSGHLLCNWTFEFVELSREIFESLTDPSKDGLYQDHLADTFYSLPEYTISPIKDVLEYGLSNSELYLVERACASIGGYDLLSSKEFSYDIEIDSLIIHEFIGIHAKSNKKIHDCAVKQMWNFPGFCDQSSGNCEKMGETTNHRLPIIPDSEMLDFMFSSYSLQLIDINFYHDPFKCVPLEKHSIENNPDNIIILESILYSLSKRVSLQKQDQQHTSGL